MSVWIFQFHKTESLSANIRTANCAISEVNSPIGHTTHLILLTILSFKEQYPFPLLPSVSVFIIDLLREAAAKRFPLRGIDNNSTFYLKLYIDLYLYNSIMQ
jgi:hypothetical protein